MNRTTLSAIAFCFAVVVASATNADILEWNFEINEQQVKNGPEPDGSTNSPGKGTGTIFYNSETNTLSYSLQWDGMVGDLTKLHIHGPADANSSNPQHIFEIYGPPTLPAELVTTSADISGSRELTTLIQTGFDPLEPQQVVDIMVAGNAYVNVHTSVFGTGEIRGNLGIPIPEPSSTILTVIGVSMFVLQRRRTR
ncbi:MAG: CHRD domain-containing protein [Planctomycetales bacterium]|nr:CHRD domain-containing protein [Planctomycetales bacterium]